ncbi:MAG: hypothetical protein M1828_001680 [Chrysothrix sp. TS-e1954]|nr:MAG: hypothetical protein M1828_001680 [Chrysothrix sp. TS-e1954]
MAHFMRTVNKNYDIKLETFADLHRWSVSDDTRSFFWAEVLAFGRPIHDGSYKDVIQPKTRMDAIPRFFEGLCLNFAENVLYTSALAPGSPSSYTTRGKEDDKIACTEIREGCSEIREVTWRDLRTRVGRLASSMRAHGMNKGDRAAVVASNSIDTLTVFLAITSIGGSFSSSSTDMGTKGVLDRLTQIKPAYVFVDDGALYNGNTLDLRQKMSEIVQGMEFTSEFKGLVSMQRWQSGPLDISSITRCTTMANFTSHASTTDLHFTRLPFAAPFLVVYSSGTTGQPKCIVHSTGGFLISTFKEGLLHRDINPSTVALQYTTTGWIMYLTSVSSLIHGARAVLYDGSPFQPNPQTFVKMIGEQRVTNLGVSPKWFQTLIAANIVPRQLTDLSSLRAVSSTGMVLPTSIFNWFYDVGFPPHAQLANISGGTDLAGCFGLENPLTPVYCGGSQGFGLGIAVEVYDSSIAGGKGVKGLPVPDGTPGDLVATKSFPNQPAMFWPGDAESMNKYWESYFGRFDDVWTHGDYIQINPTTGQIIFLGRADGVLNPSGVRFGSAEIYNVIEKNFPKTVADSLVVGQRREHDQDENVLLFLKMQENTPFSSSVVQDVKGAIARECSKRHVPKYVFETPEIPTTVNMKKVETPVKHIVSGRSVKPSGTLLNPKSLEFYYKFAKVEDLLKTQGSRQSKL